MKFTEKDIKEMKRLFQEGLTPTEIAIKFETFESNVRYHIDPDYRKRHIRTASRNIMKKIRNPLIREAVYEQQRLYAHNRYRIDPEFRERKKENARRWRKANKKAVHEQKRRYKLRLRIEKSILIRKQSSTKDLTLDAIKRVALK